MILDLVSKVCLTVCIVCIVMGLVLSLAIIWLELWDNEIAWKAWLSLTVFFLASALTISVNKTFAWKSKDEK